MTAPETSPGRHEPLPGVPLGQPAGGAAPSPEALDALAGKFEREIGGVYGYVAAALRQQAHDRRRMSEQSGMVTA